MRRRGSWGCASWFTAAGFTALAALASFTGSGCSSSSKTTPTDAAIDTPIDTPDGLCGQCRSDQMCVARFNGTCGRSVECVARTVDCPSNACSTACQTAYCPQPYQCQNRPPCGTEPPTAFTCYGP